MSNAKKKYIGTGIRRGHGGNTANLPLIREREDFARGVGFVEAGSRFFKAGKLTVILSKHPITERWHMSIAHPDRYPTWDEIAYIRYELIPQEIYMAMLLPPPSDYVNLHNFCFHLYEIERPPEV